MNSGPRSAAVLCIRPATPDAVRKCTTNPSSAVVGRSARFTSAALTPTNSPSVTRTWSITCEPCAPSQPPPCSAPAHHSGNSADRSASTGTCSTKVAILGTPMTPSCTARARSAWPVSKRNSVPRRCTTPARSAAASSCSASAGSRAKGFSHNTCLPLCNASSTRAAWVCGGVATVTAAMSGSASASVNDVDACGTSNMRARAFVFTGSRPINARTSKPAARNARTWVKQPNPVPATATPVTVTP